ncbi:MAG: helix-turn-helix transcriptional regulator [Rubrivivax sp.]|nr:helix-turn-helix transcriptional regulator [Rubrivivax sp.]
MPTDTDRPGLAPLPERLRFGRFELRPLEQRVLADGEPLAIRGRAYDLLVALVQRAGRVVPRQELIEAVWPGRFVEENNLSVQVNGLRKALGGDILVTVPGRGYRFVAPLAAADGVIAAGAAPVAATPPAPPALRTHLPVAQPLLVGRSEDLAALGTLVDQHRLVTLTGAGGMGKTRLAQALLLLHEGRHAHGVCWVELGAVGDPAALPGTVATALGLRPPPGDALAGLAQGVASLQMLVALDNAEHLLADVAALAQALLDAAPGLRLLVTSQAPLKLPSERVMRLPGLSLPQGPLPAVQAQAFGAVALFVDRAQAADSRFVLADAQVGAVIDLCRQLDGLPLAIELAAARAPLLGIERLLAALPERLRLLTGSRDRGAPPRQRTLQATLRWSHDLLAPREQRLFRRLAVVAGSASLPLVQAVAQGPDEAADPWEVLDALDELVQRSLAEVQVQALPDGGTSEPRYRLLESPLALAQEMLDAAGERAAVRERHARALLQQMEQAEQAMEGGHIGVEAWRRDGEADLDNARAALAHAQAAGDASLVLALGTALLPRLPAPLHAERLALADRIEPLIAQEPDAALRQRAWAALGTALANMRPRRSRDAAQHALAEARAASDASGDRWPLYNALCEAADVVADEAEAAQAQALLAEARAIEDPAWPPVRLRAAARVQASIAAAQGDALQALALYRRLLALSQAAGDPSLMTRINIADIELWAGDAEAAVATGQALVEMLSKLRDENHLAYARVNLAAAWLALGNSGRARPVLQAAWPAARRVDLQGWCADYMALLAALEGRAEAAARLLGAADERYAAGGATRQTNEAAARRRTQDIVHAALGEQEAAAQARIGAALPDEALAALAFEAPAPAG